jgi:hypothetical protein
MLAFLPEVPAGARSGLWYLSERNKILSTVAASRQGSRNGFQP